MFALGLLVGCEAQASDASRAGGSATEEERMAAVAPLRGEQAGRAPHAFGAAAQELPEGVTPAMVARGRTLFADDALCYNCHGADGRGIPQLGANLTDGEWLHVDGSYAALVRLVREGVPSEESSVGMPMPPGGGARLREEDIRAVAAYVWTLSR